QESLQEYGRHSRGRRGGGEACRVISKSEDSRRQAFIQEDGLDHSGG
ncbi:hypothetical protein A2U01_0099547, partial [Trifolium medium]|nr:hypothetical protein [Trifolium medium]